MAQPDVRGQARVTSRPALPGWLPRWTLLVLSVLGWGLFLRAIIINALGTVSLSGEEIGGMGVDTYAYWLAGANVAAGDSPYLAHSIQDLGGYLYPPPFAQAWVPLSSLPATLIDWGWRVLGVLSVRYMAGSWQVAGLWWLFPGSIVEITAGNITFQIAAVTVAGLRGHAEGVLPAAIVKFSTVAVVPFLWLRRPATRHGLLLGSAVAAAVLAVSFVLDPGLWREYVDFIVGQGALANENASIVTILPTPAADFLLRLAIAAAVVVAAIRFDSPHLAYVAAFLLTPTLWVQRFSVLLALLTLENDEWLRPYRWPWRSAGNPQLAAVEA